MQDVEGLSFQRDGGVATVTLNRPERLNAITWKMVEGIIDFTEECAAMMPSGSWSSPARARLFLRRRHRRGHG